MTPDDLRRHGHRLVDWVADYLEGVGDYPVASRSAPGDVRAALPPHPPTSPEPFDAVLDDVASVVLPGITHWQSPDFFAYFPANASGPSILGELLSAGLGVQGMLWATSPACTELETHVLDWVVDLLGLPDRFRSDGPGGGVIEDSASSATLVAVLAARHRAGGAAAMGEMVGYASAEAHSSVRKAFTVAGFRDDQLRVVDVDEHQALRLDHLRTLVEEDVAAGRRPFFACATVGTTGTMAVDPVRAVAELVVPHGTWVHVDAAMAGAAGVVPELRWVNDGLELVDSWCFDPHKWLFTNFDCDCLYVADRSALVEALSIVPEYLRNAASDAGDVIDYRDWQVPLGRRFRALKLWFVIRHYGAEGLRHHIGRHVELAQGFAARVEVDPRFELVRPAELSLVCFRAAAGDDESERIMHAVNASGRALLSHTRVDERFVIRASIGQTTTEQRHVDALWELLGAAADGRPIEPRLQPDGFPPGARG
ncbi:aspartate aminotransferase family protein [Actinomarinicola tropica]|uniref:Aspartate aminotransferase family protein n=2 Tax=Actinomarinicola tropica TaxID=2789776 RepID=A0A5Q2RPN3_9ACTN|nr:aspartate aminotransferase family protein [Actinomarinicola tropica]